MKIYLVGGAIRDKLLNLPVFEKDWVVTGSTEKEMISLGYKKISKYFPVFINTLNNEQYSLARIEKKKTFGYNGFISYYFPNITLKQDLYRRDLTINAIAQSKNGNFIDPYGGIKDINNKILRHISDSFTEDPLRILRVARFAAKLNDLGFKISNKTLNLMKKMVINGELKYISKERIWIETKKALSTSSPHIYFKILRKCFALSIIFPNINILYNRYVNKFNDNKNDAVHSLLILKNVSKINKSIDIRFASLLHEIYYIKFTNNLCNKYIYKKINNKLIENFCKNLSIPNNIKYFLKLTINNLNYLNNLKKLSPNNIIKLFKEIDFWHKPYNLEKLLIISKVHEKFNIKYKFKKNNNYEYLNLILKKINKINIKNIINDGFCGKNIKNEFYCRIKKELKYILKNN